MVVPRLRDPHPRHPSSFGGGSEALKEHVEQLIDAVDQFIRSSPLGQFEARLSLLESYGRFIDHLVRLAPPKESQGLKGVGMVLQNVTTFFRQFDERISGTLQSQRAGAGEGYQRLHQAGELERTSTSTR